MSSMNLMMVQVDRVVQTNEIAGKGFPFTSSDIDKQSERVDEESNEMMDHLDSLINTGVNKPIMVNLMDDICDIFVTLSYECYMLGYHQFNPASCNADITKDGMGLLSQFLKSREDVYNRMNCLFKLAAHIQEYPESIGCKKFDILSAFTLINDNNLSKFIPEHTKDVDKIIKDTYDKYSDREIYHIFNKGYVVFKNKSDNKYLKPSTFIDVDITDTVEVL